MRYVSSERQRETGLYIYILCFSDLHQTKPGRQAIMLFAFPFTVMNEYEGKCSEKDGIHYVPFVWFLCDGGEEMKHI